MICWLLNCLNDAVEILGEKMHLDLQDTPFGKNSSPCLAVS
jgi:hypothetical protein